MVAKHYGAPIHSLLGGSVRDRVKIYANGWYTQVSTPEDELPVGDGPSYVYCESYRHFAPFSCPLHSTGTRPRGMWRWQEVEAF